jgi:ankyrin repeat protein
MKVTDAQKQEISKLINDFKNEFNEIKERYFIVQQLNNRAKIRDNKRFSSFIDKRLAKQGVKVSNYYQSAGDESCYQIYDTLENLRELLSKVSNCDDISTVLDDTMKKIEADEENIKGFNNTINLLFAAHGIETEYSKLHSTKSFRNLGIKGTLSSSTHHIIKPSRSYEMRRDSENNTPLHEAAKNGNLKELKKELKASGNAVSVTNDFGYTPLHYAARYNHFDAVELLVRREANVNSQNYLERNTALFYAAQNGNIKIAHLLLENGAKVSIVNKDNDTPLDIALNHNDFDLAHLFIKYGMKRNNSNIMHTISEEKNKSKKASKPFIILPIENAVLKDVVDEGDVVALHDIIKENNLTIRDIDGVLPKANKKLKESENIVRLLNTWHKKISYDRDYAINTNEIELLNKLAETIEAESSQLDQNVLTGFILEIEKQNPSLKKISTEAPNIEKFKQWIDNANLDTNSLSKRQHRLRKFVSLVKDNSLDKAKEFLNKQTSISLDLLKTWIKDAENNKIRKVPSGLEQVIDLLKTKPFSSAINQLFAFATEMEIPLTYRERARVGNEKNKEFVKYYNIHNKPPRTSFRTNIPIIIEAASQGNLKKFEEELVKELKANNIGKIFAYSVQDIIHAIKQAQIPSVPEESQKLDLTLVHNIDNKIEDELILLRNSSNNNAPEVKDSTKDNAKDETILLLKNLFIAFKERNISVVKDLLNKLDIETELGESEKNAKDLHEAVKNGDITKVEQILSLGKENIDIDLTNEYGETALHLAAGIGNEKIVKLLIDNGADINLNLCKQAPLHRAITCSNEAVVKVLLDEGAEANLYPKQDTLIAWHRYCQCLEIVTTLDFERQKAENKEVAANTEEGKSPKSHIDQVDRNRRMLASNDFSHGC